jgi:hypothetical protein
MTGVWGLLLAGLMMVGPIGAQETMNQLEMESYVIDHDGVDVEQHEPGYVLFIYNQVRMALVSDVAHDRMRIIAPVERYENLSEEQITKVMEANFHSALDARYGLSNGLLYSAYIHPLSPLTTDQLQDAMDQVSTLAQTFGTGYSSGRLSFQGAAGNEETVQ